MSNLFLSDLYGGENVAMTCKDMSKLFDKRHDSVKRTIKTLAGKGVIAQPQSVIEQSVDKLGRPRNTELFVFQGDRGKRDSLIVAAQISPEFTADIVDRWIFLENEIKSLTQQLEEIQIRDAGSQTRGSFHAYGLNERKREKKENAEAERVVLTKMRPLLTNLVLH